MVKKRLFRIDAKSVYVQSATYNLGHYLVDLLQFQLDFSPQAKLVEAFIYMYLKNLQNFYRILGHMVIGLKQVRTPIGT